MAIFKCKICGGSLEIDSSQSVATCEYCGTKQTLPKLDDERRANLYDRANHFRRNNDFDKAMGIYENILNEDNADAEAYWSIVLCRYGIEYVEDPGTRKRVPTVNRAQFTSIFDDEDYKSAVANADGYQREIYEAEATIINEIQKGILAISQKEEPFDVFVCYKETDNNGRRTQDSVLATELYHELTREGFKVFFSRITLEDKLGIAYEPYIFAALHSAKVMVVLGTRPEHFNAVWVKNEWSRYLALIKNGAKKTLIPAYRDMNPYDLPEEFSHLQAQDMSKLGFMQDLTRGIKKIVEANAPKTTVKETIVATAATLNVSPLLKRAFMFLEDGDFDRADDFCEQVLNQDPENAQAYVGKLMAELHVKRQDDLANYAEPFDNNKNYQKAVRFADSTLAAELKGYIATIKDRKARIAEEKRKESLYNGAMDDYKSADVSRIQNAIKVFTSLAGYRDSDDRIRLCQAKIDQIHIKEENDRIERERLEEQKRIADEQARIEKLRRDEQRKIESEKRAKKAKKAAKRIFIGVGIIIALFVALVIGVIVYLNVTDKPIDNDFNQKESQQIRGLTYYVPANWVYDAEGSSEDTKYYVRYNNWDEFIAMMCLDYIGETDIKTVDEAVLDYTEDYTNASVTTQTIGEQNFAVISYVRESDNYCSLVYITEKDSSVFQVYFRFTSENSGKEIFQEIVSAVEFDQYVNPKEKTYSKAIAYMTEGKYAEALSAFSTIESYKDSKNKIEECNAAIIDKKYDDAVALMNNTKYKDAIDVFSTLKGYKDSAQLLKECVDKYCDILHDEALNMIGRGEYRNAYINLMSAGNYKGIRDALLNNFKLVAAKEIRTNADGDKTIIERTYEPYGTNTQGILIKEIETYADGDKFIVEEIYDASGRLIVHTNTLSSGKQTGITYTYDATNNLLVQSNYVDYYGQLTTTDYVYDSSGRLVKKVAVDEDGSEETTMYTYNSEDQLIKEYSQTVNEYHPKEYPAETTIDYTYDSKENMVKEVWTFDSGSQSISEYIYDDSGRLIKEISGSSGQYTSEYTYDENHFLIKKTEYTKDEVEDITEYENYFVLYSSTGFID